MGTTLLYILGLRTDEFILLVIAVIIGLAFLIGLYIILHSPKVVLSHWHHAFDNFTYSPQDFYTSAEQAITAKNVPGLSFDRINHWQKGILGEQREYLRIIREKYIFDICAAPFGSGFFISWRLIEKRSFLKEWAKKHPAFAAVLDLKTFYEHDTEIMFKEFVHKGLMEAIDEMTNTKGLRALSETERKPVDTNK